MGRDVDGTTARGNPPFVGGSVSSFPLLSTFPEGRGWMSLSFPPSSADFLFFSRIRLSHPIPETLVTFWHGRTRFATDERVTKQASEDEEKTISLPSRCSSYGFRSPRVVFRDVPSQPNARKERQEKKTMECWAFRDARQDARKRIRKDVRRRRPYARCTIPRRVLRSFFSHSPTKRPSNLLPSSSKNRPSIPFRSPTRTNHDVQHRIRLATMRDPRGSVPSRSVFQRASFRSSVSNVVESLPLPLRRIPILPLCLIRWGLDVRGLLLTKEPNPNGVGTCERDWGW